MKTPKKPVTHNISDAVAALVLCKGELFFQTATGKTLKSEYPRNVAQSKEAADKLGVEFLEQ